MKFCIIILWLFLWQWADALTVSPLLAMTVDKQSAERLLELQTEARGNLEKALKERSSQSNVYEGRSQCQVNKLRFRKEWRALSKKERRSYIEAIYCLQGKPSLFDEKIVPAATRLFDDFTVLHINQTHLIHNNFIFLVWHRYFTHIHEKLLREKCGYKGPYPYWEWGYDVYDPEKSPLLDGSEFSLGSNGEPQENHNETWTLWPPPPIEPTPDFVSEFPAGTGGGCVHTGPFSDMTVNFGPIARGAYRSLENKLQHRPQCLIRDFNPWIGQHYLAFNWTVWAIEQSVNVMELQARITGDRRQGHSDIELNKFGAHGGGHYFGGSGSGALSDIYASPQDPLFFLHQTQIDRMWAIWQWLDIEKRRYAIYGTMTYENLPPSRNGTLDDVVDLRPMADPITIRDVMDVVNGPYCFFYE